MQPQPASRTPSGVRAPARSRNGTSQSPTHAQAVAPSSSSVPSDQSVHDELADLFIDDGAPLDDRDPRGRGDADGLSVVVLVTAGLGGGEVDAVRAYASLAAQSRGLGSAAIVYLGPMTSSIEIIGEPESGSHGPIGTREWLRDEHEGVGMVVVHAGTADDPATMTELASPELDLDTVVVLARHDEDGAVGGYAAVKRLWSSARGLGLDRPRWPVRVVGVGEVRRLRAESRIRRAAAHFLNAEIDCGPGVPEHVSVDTRRVAEGAGRLGVSEVVELLRTPPATPTAVPDLLPADHAAADEPAVPAAVQATGSPSEEKPEKPVGPPGDAGLSHAGLIEGLSALRVPCPVASSIELAVDEAGGLHLVATSPENALEQLSAAESWAALNEPLIRLCDDRVRTTRLPGRHVLLQDARAARPLLDGPVRLHLARLVTVGGCRAWIVDPLN